MCSKIFQNQKNGLPCYNNKKFKKLNNDIFPKELTHGFGPKIETFPNFFLVNIGQENVFYDIVERKNSSLGYKTKNLKKSKNWDFSKGVNPWFWSKMAIFPTVFLGNICQENVIYDIVERKNAFLSHKNNKFKKAKNWHFSKRVNQWFWSKNWNFSNFFFLGNIGQENVFYYILEPKNLFLGYKNKKFKKSKYWHFSKGVNAWFWSKNGRFSNIF